MGGMPMMGGGGIPPMMGGMLPMMGSAAGSGLGALSGGAAPLSGMTRLASAASSGRGHDGWSSGSVGAAASGSGGDGEAGRNAGAALSKPPSEYRLQRLTVLAERAIHAAFPEIKEFGGYRPDALKWHPNGLAIDVMIPNPTSAQGKALGDRVLTFVMANAKRFGLDHAIWRQTMYTQGSAPQLMADRGSLTQNHFDHVHVATSGGGYP